MRQPRASRDQRPFMVIWEVTQACDLACLHCRAMAQPQHHPQALTTEEGKTLLTQIRQFGLPSPIVVFTGGDPFKRPDLHELVSHASEIGLVAAVSPSATPLLNRTNLEKIKSAGARAISLSLDAPTAAAHDAFRGVPGSYQLTIDGWKAAREVGLKVQVNSTVTRHNLDSLGQLLGQIQELGAMTWSVFFLVPTGRAREEQDLTADECEAVMHFLVDANRYLSVKTTEGHHFKRVVLQRAAGEAPPDHPLYHRLKAELEQLVQKRGLVSKVDIRRTPMNINAANGFVFISHLGEVFPSGFLPISAGNVRRQSLVDIYRDAPLFRQLRDPAMLRGRCARCEFKEVCAGSRSRAFALSGDPHDEDPYCNYQPRELAHQ
ncbi:MAG: TIGR04053 family radical SAM/SPASM domain-containing protein [Candidatus Eremiobacteraeota bacterium]|nr:TIGR04053 family radical SAM/SPASM domain-containing protein [Candidatus Eremiobacteraeota bacterium]